MVLKVIVVSQFKVQIFSFAFAGN